jgi:hypothetical protein
MRNPWTAKNPFMSAWLSAANSWAGTARGLASAEAQRQATAFQAEAQRQAVAFQAEAAKQVMEFWSGLFAWPPAAATKPARRAGAASGGRRRAPRR